MDGHRDHRDPEWLIILYHDGWYLKCRGLSQWCLRVVLGWCRVLVVSVSAYRWSFGGLVVVFGCCGGVALVFFVVEIFWRPCAEILPRDLTYRPVQRSCAQIAYRALVQRPCIEILPRAPHRDLVITEIFYRRKFRTLYFRVTDFLNVFEACVCVFVCLFVCLFVWTI